MRALAFACSGRHGTIGATVRKLWQNIDPRKVPETILGRKSVNYVGASASLLRKFRAALAKAELARSEKPMQVFLEENPITLLSLVSPHTSWVFPRLALQEAFGGGWEPDFLVCDWTSLGPEWTIVEIESPTKQPISRRGPSKTLETAHQQIRDYRDALKRHSERHQGEALYGHRQKHSWIIVGRRQAEQTILERDRLASRRDDGIEVASWDRLLDCCKQMVEYRTLVRKQARTLKRRSSN